MPLLLTLLGLLAPDDHADEVVKAITHFTSKPACLSLTQTKGDIRAVKVVDWSESGQKQLADSLNLTLEEGSSVVLRPNLLVYGRYKQKGTLADVLTKQAEPLAGLKIEKTEDGSKLISTPEPLTLGLWQLEEADLNLRPTLHWWIRSHLVKVYVPTPMPEEAFLRMIASSANATFEPKNNRVEIGLDPREYRREMQNWLLQAKASRNPFTGTIATTFLKALPDFTDASFASVMAAPRRPSLEKTYPPSSAVFEQGWQAMKIYEGGDDLDSPDIEFSDEIRAFLKKDRAKMMESISRTAPIKICFHSTQMPWLMIPVIEGTGYRAYVCGNQKDEYEWPTPAVPPQK